jgi:hypothetical protein
MNAYLGGLIARNLAPPAMAVRPRLRSLFEPPLVRGIGDSSEGSELEESAAERLAESPPASPHHVAFARTAPVAPQPAEGSAHPVAPVARIEPAPEVHPLSDAQSERQPGTRRTDAVPELNTDLGPIRPAMPEPPHWVERGYPINEQRGAHSGVPSEPSPSSPDRLVVERETHTRERRTEIIDRSTVAPVTRPQAPPALTATRVAMPRIDVAQAASPSITVTIGRVDVRAVVAPGPSVQVPRPVPRPAAPSLESYLRERSGGTST